jgi:hypothetical protein
VSFPLNSGQSFDEIDMHLDKLSKVHQPHQGRPTDDSPGPTDAFNLLPSSPASPTVFLVIYDFQIIIQIETIPPKVNNWSIVLPTPTNAIIGE